MSTHYQRHVLTEPMVIHSGALGSTPGLLPIGTSLRYTGSLPEGIDRYHVVVNVERCPLPLDNAPRPDMVEPVTAFGRAEVGEPLFGPEELYDLLRTLGVRRGDLELIVSRWSDDP